ncbi:MAG TPA: D-arabinose 5-phosphate isomerase, partial [Xanthomonadaceae bacterium]|nr:D-arabinose 5-phosphate isomerase [Xanthomonadaceae bacterium]
MAVSPLSPDTVGDANLVASGRRVVEIERGALAAVGARIGAEFAAA